MEGRDKIPVAAPPSISRVFPQWWPEPVGARQPSLPARSGNGGGTRRNERRWPEYFTVARRHFRQGGACLVAADGQAPRRPADSPFKARSTNPNRRGLRSSPAFGARAGFLNGDGPGEEFPCMAAAFRRLAFADALRQAVMLMGGVFQATGRCRSGATADDSAWPDCSSRAVRPEIQIALRYSASGRACRDCRTRRGLAGSGASCPSYFFVGTSEVLMIQIEKMRSTPRKPGSCRHRTRPILAIDEAGLVAGGQKGRRRWAISAGLGIRRSSRQPRPSCGRSVWLRVATGPGRVWW